MRIKERKKLLEDLARTAFYQHDAVEFRSSLVEEVLHTPQP
jgi:hypothetical protein